MVGWKMLKEQPTKHDQYTYWTIGHLTLVKFIDATQNYVGVKQFSESFNQ